ncbi:lipopolysaccharide biosynthesis protein [Halogeometricum borinquense]|uniref:lipopolysaccharide biosynthesis protein n=1 Tax=Halogeometricum borinquense TaxID=60847 RepID=UPI00343C2421
MTEQEASDISLGGETVKAALGKFIMALIGFVGTIIFARWLGSDSLGGYYLLLTAAALSNRPVQGLAEAIQKRGSESGFELEQTLSVGTLVVIGWTTLAALIAYALRGYLQSFFGFSGSVSAFVALLASLSGFFILQSQLVALGRISRNQWFDTVRSYLTFPAQLGFLILGWGAAGVAIGEVVATLLLYVPMYRSFGTGFARPTVETMRSLWEYAKYSIPNEYLTHTYSQLDMLLLGFLVGKSATGEYGVALRLTVPATFVSMVATQGLFSRVSNLRSKGERVDIDVQNTLSFASIVAIPMLVGGVLLDEQLVVTAYSAEYKQAATLLVGLLVFQLLRTQSQVLDGVVAGLDRPNVKVKVNSVLLAVNIIVGVALTVAYGAIGVVIATVIAEAVRYGFLAWYVKQSIPSVSLFPRSMAEQAASAVGMGVVVYGLRQTLAIDSWLILGVVLGAGAVAYTGILFSLSESFRVTITGISETLYGEWRRWSPLSRS